MVGYKLVLGRHCVFHQAHCVVIGSVTPSQHRLPASALPMAAPVIQVAAQPLLPATQPMTQQPSAQASEPINSTDDTK